MPVKRNNEHGFTMVTMMNVMFIVVMLSVATFAATQGDEKTGRGDRDRRQAYAAAEAGIQNYLFHLVQDNDYWSKCTQVKSPHAVNQRWSGTGADTRTNWMTVPGSNARYALELLPANGAASCVKGNLNSMIDKDTGTFRIRATGKVTSGKKRSIVSTFRRSSFLNYVYFTDLETQDPALYTKDAMGAQTKENPRTGTPKPPQRNIVQWATETCGTTYWYKNRKNLSFVGNHRDNRGDYDAGIFLSNEWQPYSKGCQEIQFFGPSTKNGTIQDNISGPVHTNDELLICNFPKMGRSPQDVIETSGPGRALTGTETNATVGWRNAGGSCAANSEPNVNFTSTGAGLNANLGIWRPNAPLLTLPPSNTSLKRDTAASYRFVGRTQITFDGDGYMHVTGKREDGTALANVRVAEPADGVIYITNGSCGATYNPLAPYVSSTQPSPTGCGNAEVKGTYTSNITIAADNDIIIMDDLKRPSATSDALLGLISNNFIRVYHPVKNFSASTLDCDNNGGPAPDVQIDAAILSLAHSFIHDYWFCGAPTGKLTINGVIAQKFRGPVGTGSGATVSTGFIKNYVYNDNLRFRSPPKFLDPIQAGWLVQLYTEQVPAT
jgi:Tfp pilus assembly protein PilX